MTLPYALGCPSCPHYVELSAEDCDTSVSELYGHIRGKHADYDRHETERLLAKAHELTEAEAAKR